LMWRSLFKEGGQTRFYLGQIKNLVILSGA
jgi:hypothetical protein